MPPEFNRDSIRLLVFFDSDDTGLQIIFDSKTLRIVPPIDNDNSGARTSTTVNPYATTSGISSTMVRMKFIWHFLAHLMS